jgi:hypothetical protein
MMAKMREVKKPTLQMAGGIASCCSRVGKKPVSVGVGVQDQVGILEFDARMEYPSCLGAGTNCVTAVMWSGSKHLALLLSPGVESAELM